MAQAPASLDDMMTALTRADSAGNTGDAASIARMIQETYPQHVKAALGNTPPMPAPPLDGPVTAPYPNLPGFGPAPALRSPIGAPQPPGPIPGVGTLGQDQGAGPQVAPPGGGSGPAGPMPASGAPSGPGAPPAAPQGMLAGVGTDLMGTLRGFAGSALPGGNWLAAALSTGMSQVGLGGNPNNTIADNKAQIDQAQAQAAQAAPLSSALGTMVGTGTGLGLEGAALTKGASLAANAGLPVVSQVGNFIGRAASALGTAKAGFIPESIRLATAGGVGGLATAVNDVVAGHTNASDLVSNGLIDAGAGAIGGATVGQAAGVAWGVLAKKFTNLMRSGALNGIAGDSEAANAMLKTMKVDPDELAQTHAAAVQANGGNPVPIAAVMPAYAQAQVRKMAGQNSELGNTLNQAVTDQATDAQTHVPDMLYDAGANTPTNGLSPTNSAGVQTVGRLEAARDQAMTTAMRGGNNPIANQRVPLQAGDEDLLDHPVINSVLRANPTAQGEINGALDALDQGQSASLSVDTLDKMRQAIAMHTNADNPLIADAAKEAAGNVKQIYSRNAPYVDALGTNANHNAFIQGFGDGQGGKAISEIPGASKLAANNATGDAYTLGHGSGTLSGLAAQAQTSPSAANTVLQKIINNPTTKATIAGVHGQPAADALNGAATTLDKVMTNTRAMSPSSPVGAPSEGGNNEAFAHAAIGAATGNHHAFLYNLARGILGKARGDISDSASQRIAGMLLDPAQTQSAINVLRAHGVDEAYLAKVRAYAAGAVGAMTPTALSGQ